MGFQDLPRAKLLAIAAKGGAAVPASKRSFAKDQELARSAGRKGGQLSKRSKSNG
jgi:uncharacterized protein